jgi:hypothetical protein
VRTLESELTEVRLTTLGSVVYGALEAKERRVFIFPVPSANQSVASAGIVIWGDEKVTAESIEVLIEFLTRSKACLPSLLKAKPSPEVSES